MHFEDIPWTNWPDSPRVHEAYPRGPLLRQEESEVTLICQIQTDYSLVCAAPNLRPEDQTEFERAALFLSTVARAAPNFPSGQSTVGIVTDFKVEFRILH
jgi:hypothetical protein